MNQSVQPLAQTDSRTRSIAFVALTIAIMAVSAAISIPIGPVPFTLQMFLAGAILNAVPGIILHIVLVPLLVFALNKAGLVENNRE